MEKFDDWDWEHKSSAVEHNKTRKRVLSRRTPNKAMKAVPKRDLIPSDHGVCPSLEVN